MHPSPNLRILGLVVALGVLLGGCSSQNNSSSGQQDASQPENSPSVQQTDNLALGQVYEGDGESQNAAFDGDEATAWTGSQLTIRFQQTQTVRLVSLKNVQGSGGAFSLYGRQGDDSFALLYEQDELPSSRICVLAQDTALDELKLVTKDTVSVGEMEVSLRQTTPSPLRTVAYLPATSALLDGDTRQASFEGLSDVILISAACWDSSGKIVITDDNFVPSLKAVRANAPKDVRIFCTIAPAGSLIRGGTAGATIDSDEKRQQLSQEILRFLNAHQLDGIDFDWEFPLNQTEWDAFSRLLIQVKETLSPDGKLVSAAFYSDKMSLSGQAISSLDYLNLMAYDQFDSLGRHATYAGADEAIKTVVAQGVQPRQINLGIPFYGRPTDQSLRWDLYHQIDQSDPNLNQAGDSYYNGQTMVRDKAALACSWQLGGVMIYHLYCDKPASSPESLTRALFSYLDTATTTTAVN